MTDDEAIGRLLRDCGLLTDDTFDDDTELVLDSLTLVLLAHFLDEQHGIVVRVEDEDGLASCTRVGALRRFLAEQTGSEPASPEVLHDS